jgi:glutamate 5-kinase
MVIGSGGFGGAGWGGGLSKYSYLPESHTDFAFAVFCEEWGFILTILCIVFPFVLFTHHGFRIAKQTEDCYGKMLALGLTLLISGQAVSNMLMVMGSLPVIGVPLPFISYGGTSLVINLVCVGGLLSIHRKNVSIARSKLKREQAEADRQAAAAIGQCELMRIYDRFFLDYGSMTGQILLTKGITEHKVQKTNVISTFSSLLNMHVIPIVNENDSVATEEIVYGDNDTLSAVVAQFTGADLLVILTDTEGLYDSDPSVNPDAKLITEVDDPEEVAELAGGVRSGQGTGGMITKIHAASIARRSGIPTIVASGRNPQILYDIAEGEHHGTFFKAGKD